MAFSNNFGTYMKVVRTKFTGLPKQNLFHHYSYTPIYASLSKTCVMRCNIVALAQGPNCIYRFVDTFFVRAHYITFIEEMAELRRNIMG